MITPTGSASRATTSPSMGGQASSQAMSCSGPVMKPSSEAVNPPVTLPCGTCAPAAEGTSGRSGRCGAMGRSRATAVPGARRDGQSPTDADGRPRPEGVTARSICRAGRDPVSGGGSFGGLVRGGLVLRRRLLGGRLLGGSLLGRSLLRGGLLGLRVLGGLVGGSG